MSPRAQVDGFGAAFGIATLFVSVSYAKRRARLSARSRVAGG